MKRSVLFALSLALLLIVGLFVTHFFIAQSAKHPPHQEFVDVPHASSSLPTYFHYELSTLTEIGNLDSHQRVTVGDLNTWQGRAFELVSSTSPGDVVASKFYAALFTAQRDFGYLSYNLTGDFSGSIDPVSQKVVCLFFPEECSRWSVDSDPYSDKLADIVISKLNARLASDDIHPELYPPKEGKEYWKSSSTTPVGYGVGGAHTWLIESGHQFRIDPPPVYGSAEDLAEVKAVKNRVLHLKEYEKNLVHLWSSAPGTKTQPGKWMELAGGYMNQANMDAKNALYVRSLLSMAIADTLIAVFDSKYTYWRPRPFMRDKSLKTIVPTPNHPSYPAGYAAISSAAEAVLTRFFPERSEELLRQAKEATDSRYFAGTQFESDNAAGTSLGGSVANYVLENVSTPL